MITKALFYFVGSLGGLFQICYLPDMEQNSGTGLLLGMEILLGIWLLRYGFQSFPQVWFIAITGFHLWCKFLFFCFLIFLFSCGKFRQVTWP